MSALVWAGDRTLGPAIRVAGATAFHINSLTSWTDPDVRTVSTNTMKKQKRSCKTQTVYRKFVSKDTQVKM